MEYTIENDLSIHKINSTYNKYSIESTFLNAQGPAGQSGKSSYDIYIENGGTLSEQDWINSFVDTYNKTEIENLLDQNFLNYYTKNEINNITIDGGNF